MELLIKKEFKNHKFTFLGLYIGFSLIMLVLTMFYPWLSLLLVCGVLLVILVFRYPFLFLVLLTFGFMLHPMLVSKILVNKFQLTGMTANIVLSWKDVLLILVFIRSLFDARNRQKHKFLPIPFFYLLAFIFLGTAYLFIKSDFIRGLSGYRYDYEPFLILFAAYNLKIDRKKIFRFLKAFLIFSFLLAIWALIQANILGTKFLFENGYGNNGYLDPAYFIAGHTFQRAMGTLAVPNNYGVFVGISIIIAVYFRGFFKNKWLYYIFLTIQCISLIETFSRSAWLGLIMCIVIYVLLEKKKKLFMMIVFIATIGSLYFFVMLITNPDNTIVNYLIKTITLQDSSSLGHWNSWIEGINFITNNPIGIGLGIAGPKASALTGEFLNVESSYFLIAYELGVIGLLLFLMFNMSILRVFKKAYRVIKEEESLFIESVFYSWIVVSVSYFFLPSYQEAEVQILILCLTGLALNLYVEYKIKVENNRQ
ncbi:MULTISPECIES: O-antigen ligase family protein [Bacillus cereus group]|uniref:O-antigen ligase family protein n=1 Tax=Bacillus thuringiensis TaxID=1428 RepID=A0AAW4HXW2_BACTU|nr:O-antigen ligase family protein [Bacillus thuringiensis]MBN9900794.1 O-antigen ligase family protein [Bacillus thuringiensis]MDY7520222.1 O-antigen ligase family protein [Bacillus thuringiensis]